MMPNCVTCGRELYPERAEKYDYCTDPECQKRNAKGLTILALGVNKAADHYQLLDERTRDKVASGAYVEEAAGGKDLAARQATPRRHGPNRGDRGPGQRSGEDRRPARAGPRRPVGSGGSRPWTKAQEDLALIYNRRGMRPDEIAAKLGISTYLATQIILAAKNRAKP
jgi:hypothetical protein